MAKKNPGSRTSSVSKESQDSSRERVIRSAQARLDDPLFVPRIESLRINLESATAADEYPALIESICGVVDDSQPVEQYDGTLGVTAAFVAANQAAACQVQWNNNLASIYSDPGEVSGLRWGTGTMITDDLMLTCGHLFDQDANGWQLPRQNGTTTIISPQEIALNMRVNFNFQVDPSGNLRTEQSFPITELIEYRLGKIDMAICRVGGNPGATFGRARVSNTDAAKGDMICIIGHPAGRPKRIEAGPTTDLIGERIYYNDIDTLGGNSGSGILRASDGRLVGIHTNGGCNPTGTGSNFGQRIQAVIAVSPTLQRLLSPKAKVLDDIPVKLKFRDDVPVKIKAFDDPTKFKAFDDVKQPGFDKGFDVPNWPGGFGGPLVFGHPVGAETQPARPFILATPHHSNAWNAAGQQPQASVLAQIEAALMQIGQAMAAGQAEMARLNAEYHRLLAQYEAAGGNLGNR